MGESAPKLFGIPHALLVALLLGLFATAGFVSLRGDSVTSDEAAHLPAGYTYWQRFDFRLNPEHPPLSKLWAALPLVWLQPREADYESPHWRGSSVLPGTTMTRGADQWTFGFEMLHGPLADERRRDPARLLLPARLMMLGGGLLLGLALYAWTRQLWGADGALLALTLYCLSPTMLAHARLVTTDLPIAAGYLGTLWAFWRWTRKPNWQRAALTGLAFGLALLVKFSALLLLPILLVVGVLWIYEPGTERWERTGKIGTLALALLLIAAIGWGTIWAGYGFRYQASPDPTYQLDWERIELSGPKRAAIDRLTASRALPQAYVYGLAYFLSDAKRRLAYLNGEERVTGWWYYFPEAFALKTPPATLLLLAALAVVGWRRTRGRSYDAWFVVLPVLVYAAASMTSSLNIGHRHLAVIYPLLFAACGALPCWLAPTRWRRAAGGLLLAGLAVSFAAATPSYLGYFNLFARGEGWRYLLDSNLDWGQDMGRLARLLESRGIEEVHLAYFGNADPRAYGIRFTKVLLVHDYYPELPRRKARSGHWLAVSRNLLHGLYTNRESEIAGGALRRGWLDQAVVDRWVALRDRETRRGREVEPFGAWLVAGGHLSAAQVAELDARTVGAWLEGVRTELQPAGAAGRSILLYRMP